MAKTLLARNADLLVTMDAARREIRGGGLFVDGNRIVAVGPTAIAAGASRRGDRSFRPRRHSRPRQHPPPHVPEPDPGGAGGAGRRAVRLADRAVSDLGRAVAGDDRGLDQDRDGGADAVRLHHRHGPSLPLSERHPPRRRDRGGRRDRHALPCEPRGDEPRREQGRAAARSPGRGRGGGAARDPAPHRGLSRQVPLCDAADRGRAVLALHREPGPDARGGGARPQLRRLAPHPSRRERQGRRLHPRDVRLHAGAICREARLGRARRLACPLREARRARHRPVRPHRHRRRPLSLLEHAARLGDRPGRPHACRRRAGRARRRRLGLERLRAT